MKWKNKIYKHLTEYKINVLHVLQNGIFKNKEYGHILPINDGEKNYMCEKAICDSLKIKRHANWYHLNSSQSMCINFFSPLFKDGDFSLLNSIIELIIGKRISIIDARYEYTPREHSTNFDFYCKDDNASTYYFEIKYTENDISKAGGGDNPKQTFDNYYRELIENGSYLKYCLSDAGWEVFMKRHYQAYRNIVMADSNKNNYCIFITMEANNGTREELQEALQDMNEEAKYVKCIYWENIIDQVIYLFDDLHNALLSNYYREFKKKYII